MMPGLQQWLTASSMSWRGLRWGAAILSVAAHSAAASFAWVMIETKPAQVIEAFNVELVTIDENRGSIQKNKNVSDSVTAKNENEESKTDLVRAVSSTSAQQMKPEKKLPERPVEKTRTFPQLEIEMAHAAPVVKSTHKPVRQYPKTVKPIFNFSLPPRKPQLQKSQKQKLIETQKVVKNTTLKPKSITEPNEQKQTQPQSQIASLPSQGGVGGGETSSKGETVPMTAASYSIGTLGNKPPTYPERARRNEFEGRVLLRVTVLPNGKGEKIVIKSSSGYDILDEAARAAVKAWRFVPAQRAGVAVQATIDIPIVFRLTNSR